MPKTENDFNNFKDTVYDKYNRSGYLIQKDEYYIFQPKEITNENSSILERTMPIDFKEKSITIDLSKIKIRKANGRMKYMIQNFLLLPNLNT